MTIQIRKRGVRGIDVRPEFTRVGDDVIIASTLRVNENGPWQERYQVLTIRDGKIVDMQGCATRRQAERFVRRLRGSGSPAEPVQVRLGLSHPPAAGRGSRDDQDPTAGAAATHALA